MWAPCFSFSGPFSVWSPIQSPRPGRQKKIRRPSPLAPRLGPKPREPHHEAHVPGPAVVVLGPRRHAPSTPTAERASRAGSESAGRASSFSGVPEVWVAGSPPGGGRKMEEVGGGGGNAFQGPPAGFDIFKPTPGCALRCR